MWLTSDDACGPRCDAQFGLLGDLRANAIDLATQSKEQNGDTILAVHYPVFDPCPRGQEQSAACRGNCTNGGRYCAAPSGSFSGREVGPLPTLVPPGPTRVPPTLVPPWSHLKRLD